jgi:hypothetical protein
MLWNGDGFSWKTDAVLPLSGRRPVDRSNTNCYTPGSVTSANTNKEIKEAMLGSWHLPGSEDFARPSLGTRCFCLRPSWRCTAMCSVWNARVSSKCQCRRVGACFAVDATFSILYERRRKPRNWSGIRATVSAACALDWRRRHYILFVLYRQRSAWWSQKRHLCRCPLSQRSRHPSSRGKMICCDQFNPDLNQGKRISQEMYTRVSCVLDFPMKKLARSERKNRALQVKNSARTIWTKCTRALCFLSSRLSKARLYKRSPERNLFDGASSHGADSISPEHSH